MRGCRRLVVLARLRVDDTQQLLAIMAALAVLQLYRGRVTRTRDGIYTRDVIAIGRAGGMWMIRGAAVL